MRKEKCWRRKWKEDKDNFHLEICAFKCRENKKRFILFIIYFYFFFHQKEIFKWDFYLIKREKVLLIK